MQFAKIFLSVVYFEKSTLEALIYSVMSPLQLTTSKFGHLQLRYGRLKMPRSRYSLFVHYYSFEGLDSADGRGVVDGSEIRYSWF